MKLLQQPNFKILFRRKHISTRNAVWVSLILHFAFAMVFAAFYDGTSIPQRKGEKAITFELVDEHEIIHKQLQSSAVLPDETAGLNPKIDDKLGGKPKPRGLKSSRSRDLVSENARKSREAVMKASLATLSKLRDTFSFAVHQITADSLGAFKPIQGEAPDTRVIAAGLGKGVSLGEKIRAGIGGGGNCSPPILK